jgi:L-aminopeptidase/D-esterase-like protein
VGGFYVLIVIKIGLSQVHDSARGSLGQCSSCRVPARMTGVTVILADEACYSHVSVGAGCSVKYNRLLLAASDWRRIPDSYQVSDLSN